MLTPSNFVTPNSSCPDLLCPRTRNPWVNRASNLLAVVEALAAETEEAEVDSLREEEAASVEIEAVEDSVVAVVAIEEVEVASAEVAVETEVAEVASLPEVVEATECN